MHATCGGDNPHSIRHVQVTSQIVYMYQSYWRLQHMLNNYIVILMDMSVSALTTVYVHTNVVYMYCHLADNTVVVSHYWHSVFIIQQDCDTCLRCMHTLGYRLDQICYICMMPFCISWCTHMISIQCMQTEQMEESSR